MPSKSAQVMTSIERDIRVRQLQPGQPYQSAREVAQHLGVSPMTADRAMRKLVASGILQRRHGAGTFVGEGADTALGQKQQTAQIWVPSGFYSLYNVVVERIVRFVHLEFPEDLVQLLFIPDDKQLETCERMVASWENGVRPRTVVLISCDQAVQRMAMKYDLPTIATGRVSKDTCELPWIDMDYRQAGRLLAECVVRHGHRRILIIMNHIWGSGDNEFLEGVEQGIKSTGQRHVDARVRSVESEPQAIELYLRRTLRRGQAPTAVICSSKATATVAVNVAEKMGLSVPEDFLVGTVRISAPETTVSRYAFTHWASTRASDTEFRRMVKELNSGVTPDPDHYLIPVELVEPPGLHRGVDFSFPPRQQQNQA